VRLALSLLMLLMITGCRSPEAAPNVPPAAPIPTGDVPCWVDDAACTWDAERQPWTVFVTGHAALLEDTDDSAARARSEGLGRLSAWLDPALDEVERRWAARGLGEAGRARVRADAATRPAVVQGAVDRARMRGRYRDGGSEHVWLELDLEPVLLSPWCEGLQRRLAAEGLATDDEASRQLWDELRELVASWNAGLGPQGQ
jgi:hypothetical protein